MAPHPGAGNTAREGKLLCRRREVNHYPSPPMSPTWIWMQVLVVIFVLAGMVIAVVRLL